MQEVEYSLSHWFKLDFTLGKVDRWDAKRLGGTSSLIQCRHVLLSVLEYDGIVVVQIPATVGKSGKQMITSHQTTSKRQDLIVVNQDRHQGEWCSW